MSEEDNQFSGIGQMSYLIYRKPDADVNMGVKHNSTQNLVKTTTINVDQNQHDNKMQQT